MIFPAGSGTCSSAHPGFPPGGRLSSSALMVSWMLWVKPGLKDVGRRARTWRKAARTSGQRWAGVSSQPRASSCRATGHSASADSLRGDVQPHHGARRPKSCISAQSDRRGCRGGLLDHSPTGARSGGQQRPYLQQAPMDGIVRTDLSWRGGELPGQLQKEPPALGRWDNRHQCLCSHHSHGVDGAPRQPQQRPQKASRAAVEQKGHHTVIPWLE